MLWADRGFMAHSSPIPPQDSAPLPTAVKTTHSYPAEHQVVHQGELLGNSAQLWPKGFASCPSPGDKNAKYIQKFGCLNIAILLQFFYFSEGTRI